MIERGYRIVGWMCVVMGACIPFLIVGNYYRGETIPWWEPLLAVAMGGLLVLFGFLYALPDLGLRFKALFASTWGAFSIALGVVSLLRPAEVLVTHGTGPRTILMAQVRGAVLLVMGAGLVSWAVVAVVRLRRARIATPDATSR